MDTFLEVNASRLESSIKRMGRIGRVPGREGVTRLALSGEDKLARDLLVDLIEEKGLKVLIDPIGNIFGIRSSSNGGLNPILMGSHLDTVIEAGIFDGAVGVLGALEVVKRLNEEDIETENPVGVACFTNEEGVRFQPDMMGSLVASGNYSIKEAYSRKDEDGVTVEDALKIIGYAGEDSVTPSAYFELHVEQGPILDVNKLDIGIVEGVQGILWLKVDFGGAANHAGTTPYEMRRDAFLGLSQLHRELHSYASSKGALCTIGKVWIKPNAINVIPASASFTIDYRSKDRNVFNKGKSDIKKIITNIAETHGLTQSIEVLSDVQPVRFGEEIIGIIEKLASTLNYSSMRLYSGAGHDAQIMTSICPAAMIFTPSKGGVSHSPKEKTSFQNIVKGSNILRARARDVG